jgi:hypothetical protein
MFIVQARYDWMHNNAAWHLKVVQRATTILQNKQYFINNLSIR